MTAGGLTVGKTWTRRRDRFGDRIGHADHDRTIERLCCGTAPKEPHDPNCLRSMAMCGDKAGFESKAGAERRRESISERAAHHQWRVYRCSYCDLWHLTTSDISRPTP